MPELYLNYLGGLDELDLPPGYSVLTEDVGPDRSGDRYQPYRIAVRAQVVEQHLELRWMYSADLHEPQTIEAMAEAVAKALR